MKIEEVISKIRDGEIVKGDTLYFTTSTSDKKNKLEYDGEKLIALWTVEWLDLFDIYTLEGAIDMDFELYKTIKIGDLELRGVDFPRQKVYPCMNDADTLEIVLNERGNSITIGYWVMNKMGYDFKFVGNRFLTEDIEIYDLYDLLEKGQQITEQMFKEKTNG